MTEGGQRVLVLTSTFPRWQDDIEPAFVFELSRRIGQSSSVTALVPHAPGAKRCETLDGINVKRFRYAPEGWQRLAYEGGILANIRHHPWTALLLPFFAISELIATVVLIRRLKPHVIHAHWLLPQGLIAVLARWLARSNAALVVTSHGGDLYAIGGWFGRFLKRFVIRNADAITVVSSAMKAHVLVQYGDSTRIEVLPMGTDLEKTFVPGTAARDPGTVLFVGRLVEKKGVTHLIRAMELVIAQRPATTLDVVGDGPLRAGLQTQAETSKAAASIRFHGGLSPDVVADRMRSSTLFVMPSIIGSDGDREGFGLVQVEAMGCGCVVISSDHPEIRDIVTDETGLRVNPGDPNALANAILELLDDSSRREQLSKAARQHVREQFDWTSITSRYAGLFRQASEKGTPPHDG